MPAPQYLPSTTAIADRCGHEYEVIHAINDQGERVTMHTACPDPDDASRPYDANDLCPECYRAKMDRKPISFDAMTAAFRGGVLNI